MNSKSLRYQAAACLSVLCSLPTIPSVVATTIVDNGGVNSISVPSIDIEVRDSGAALPTTVNVVDGGQVGFSLNPDGTIEMADDGMGGMLPVISNTDRSIGVFHTSSLNMSGGETADSIALFDSATAAISGGAIGDGVSASGNAVVTVTGGDIANDLELTDSAKANISNGSFSGNLAIAGSGEVFLSTEAFEEASVSESGKLFMLPDAVIADVAEFVDSSHLEMTGGTFEDDVLLLNTSTALITNGVIEGALIIADDAQAEIHTAEIDEVAIEGNALLEIHGGTFGEVFATGSADEGGTTGTSQLKVDGGVFEGPVSAVAGFGVGAVFNIESGTFEEGVAARGIGAKIDLSGATIETFDASELEASNLGELSVNGATGTEVDVSASIGGKINVNQLSADTINVNSLGGFVDINGGDADVLNITSDRGFVNWRGGQFGDVNIDADSRSIITIFGSDFLVNGLPFSGGDVAPPSGDIIGLLADGSPFSALFTRRFEPQNLAASIQLVVVPEPGTIALTLLPFMGLICCSRRQSIV